MNEWIQIENVKTTVSDEQSGEMPSEACELLLNILFDASLLDYKKGMCMCEQCISL